MNIVLFIWPYDAAIRFVWSSKLSIFPVNKDANGFFTYIVQFGVEFIKVE